MRSWHLLLTAATHCPPARLRQCFSVVAFSRSVGRPARPSHRGMSTGNMFQYTHAITKDLPKSFTQHALREWEDTTSKLSYSKAAHQLELYREALEECGLKVISLSADEAHPDSVFVEDTAVVIGHRACMTRPGHPSRKGEVDSMREVLRGLGFQVLELDDPVATLDGGDILFTGQEILVGKSARSNEAAAASLARAFPEFPVTSITVRGGLHLKTAATLAADGVITVGGGDFALSTFEVLREKAKGSYKYVHLSNGASANNLFINGKAVTKPESELGSADFKVLKEALKIPIITVPFSEFYKADGCLSCCSILLQVP